MGSELAEVEEGHRVTEERIARGNPPEIEIKLAQSRKKGKNSRSDFAMQSTVPDIKDHQAQPQTDL
jgi:hypothetical protein